MRPDPLDDALLDAPLPASLTRPSPRDEVDAELARAVTFTLEPFDAEPDPEDAPRPRTAFRAEPTRPASHRVEPVSLADVADRRRPVLVVERRNRSDSGLHVAMALGVGCSLLALAVLVWSWFS